jgi:hypothetical protein
VNIEDFNLGYRCRMVQAYPVISGIRDLTGVTVEELDTGFQHCLDNLNLRRTHELWLRDHPLRDDVVDAAFDPGQLT